MNGKLMSMNDEFEKWFYELEVYSFRSERFWDDFEYASKSGDTKVIVKWLQTAFEMGYNMVEHSEDATN